METTPAPDRGPDDGPAIAPAPAHQVTLDLDLDADEPIPYALTARARRVVAPERLPDLAVVPRVEAVARRDPDQPALATAAVPDDLDDPGDTRRARARALRRAGVSVDDVALELGLDELVVRAWTADVQPVTSARRRLRSVPTGTAAGRDGPARRGAEDDARRRREDFAAARDAAHADAPQLLDDPRFTAGLGLIAGSAEIGPHGLVLSVRDPRSAGTALRWLCRAARIEPSRVRVVLRMAPQLPADVTAARWADALGVPVARISHTRWREAPDADAVEAMIRIGAPKVAGAIAGWCDGLIDLLDGGPGAVGF